jgi:ABC-type multidrug transport system fused ATPase/permease subunit
LEKVAQPISKLDQVSVGAVTNTITTLSNSIQQSISDKLAILFQSVALLVAAYIIAFKYSSSALSTLCWAFVKRGSVMLTAIRINRSAELVTRVKAHEYLKAMM